MKEQKLKHVPCRDSQEPDVELSELMAQLFTTPPIGGLDENPCAPECWCRRVQRAD